MFRDSGLTRPRLAQSISMNDWAHDAEVQKISHQEEEHPPAYAPLSCACC